MNVDVLVRKAYGKLWFYPKNELADTLLGLMGRKSFTYDQVKFMQLRGFEVTVFEDKVDYV